MNKVVKSDIEKPTSLLQNEYDITVTIWANLMERNSQAVIRNTMFRFMKRLIIANFENLKRYIF